MLLAWRVVNDGPDRLIVCIDANDGESSYCEPAGERTIDLNTDHVAVSVCC